MSKFPVEQTATDTNSKSPEPHESRLPPVQAVDLSQFGGLHLHWLLNDALSPKGVNACDVVNGLQGVPPLYSDGVALHIVVDTITHHQGVMRVDVLHTDHGVTVMQHHRHILRDVSGAAPRKQSDAQADEQRTDDGQYCYPSIPYVALIVGHTISM